MDEALFHRLSLDLTGETQLDAARSARLLRRFVSVANAQDVERLARVAAGLPGEEPHRAGAIRSQILDDDALRELAKLMLVLWYTGDLPSAANSAPAEEDYFGALLWPAARAHPPGLSGGYFGHWTYPPDN